MASIHSQISSVVYQGWVSHKKTVLSLKVVKVELSESRSSSLATHSLVFSYLKENPFSFKHEKTFVHKGQKIFGLF